MPHKPKRPSQAGRRAAERPFVDRGEFIAPVNAALKEPQRTTPLVLVFYGGPGIGKSRLRQELAKQMAADPDVVTATLDFAIPNYRQPEPALLFLRNTLQETRQVRFPSFDLAYAVLWQKSHPDTALRSEEGRERREEAGKDGPKSEGKGQEPKAKSGNAELHHEDTKAQALNDERWTMNDARSMLEPDSLLSQLLDDSGELPLIGLVPRVTAAVDCIQNTAAREWWMGRGEREVEDLPQMEPAAIVEQLPKLWAADMKAALRAGNREARVESSGAASHSLLATPHSRSAILFIDSYEKLWETGATEADFLRRDEWVRELVKLLPEALWVICGRQKLRWEEVNKDWNNALSQHELGALPEQSARQFLRSCDISSGQIQDAIIKGSQGVPHYLNLAADAVQNAKGKLQEPEFGGGGPEELAEQFTQHLDKSEAETLKVLSAARFWYYGLFEHLVTEYQTGYPLTGYDDLARFSFIKEGAAPGTRTMHDLMREALQEEQSPELRKRVHLFLHEFYAKQLEGLEVKDITARHRTALTEAFYHGRQAKSAAELWAWFEAASDVFTKAYQSALLVPRYREMIDLLEAELGPNGKETATVFCKLAISLEKQDKLDESEEQHRRALAIREKVLGPEHADVVQSLNDLSRTLRASGKYVEAEQACRRALVVSERTLGPEHPKTGDSLTGLARSLYDQGKHAEAEPLCRRALSITENALGPEHPLVTEKLYNIATMLSTEGKYGEAEPLLRRALVIAEKTLGPVHPSVASVLEGLSNNLERQGRYAEAESLARRALAIYEERYGPNRHRHVARSLDRLASTLDTQGKYSEAEPLHRRSLAITERALGPAHPESARTLINLVASLHAQGKYSEAEPLARRSLAIWEKAVGPEHPNVAYAVNGLGTLQMMLSKYDEAELLYRRALAIRERALGPEHPDVAESLNDISTLLRQQRKYAEAEPPARRALNIAEKAFGPEHPRVAERLYTLAALFLYWGKYAEVEPLARRALAIFEAQLGPNHPHIAATLVQLSGSLAEQGKHAEAESMARRALAIHEKTLGPEHPNLAYSLHGLAALLVEQGRFSVAEPLLRRALAIWEAKLGPDYADSDETLDLLAKVCEQTGRAAEAEQLSARAKAIREKAQATSEKTVNSSQ